MKKEDKKMRIDRFVFEKIWYLQTQSGYPEFVKIFNLSEKPTLGNHLWCKFVQNNHNIIALWGLLDIGNKKLLEEYINSKEFLDEYMKNQGKYLS